jgi:hypothetical protein
MTTTTYRIEMASNADGPWLRMETQKPDGLSEAKERIISITKAWPGFHFRIVRVDETVEVVE